MQNEVNQNHCATDYDSLNTRRLLIIVPIFMIAGFLIYLNVLTGDFIFDDNEYIVNNPVIKNLSNFTNIWDVRYIGYLTFGLNYYFGGLNPTHFHVFNIFIHILNSVLVYLLVLSFIRYSGMGSYDLQTRNDRILPLCVAAVFLTHPLATQSVSYITQRFSSLSAFFYMATVLFYLAGRERQMKGGRTFNVYIAAAFAMAVIGMKTKESVFTLPMMLAVLDGLLFGNKLSFGRRWRVLLPFFLLMIIIPLSVHGPDFRLFDTWDGIAGQSRKDKVFDMGFRSSGEYLLTQFNVIVTYLRLMIWPTGQRVIYDYPYSVSIFELKTALSVLILAGLMLLAFFFLMSSRRAVDENRVEARLAGIGLVWFFVSLLVESSFIPIKDVIFEHRTYLPSFGFYLFVAAITGMFMRKLIKQYNPVVLIYVFLCISLVFGILTFQRNHIWSDRFLFWDDAVIKAPNRPDVWQNRGWEYFLLGRYEDAMANYNESIRLAEELYATGRSNRSPDSVLMQLSLVYRDRYNLNLMLGDLKGAKTDRIKMQAYLSMLNDLTGQNYRP